MPTQKPITICGVDPGLAAGGAVLIEKDSWKVLVHERLYSQINKQRKEATPGDANFTESMHRAKMISDKLLGFVVMHKPRLIAVESFVDFGSQKKMTNKAGGAFFAKDRWKVPMTIGYFSAELERLRIPIIYSNAQILRQYTDEISLLTGTHTEDIISPNDHLLTNDHLIKAWCHADWAARPWDEGIADL